MSTQGRVSYYTLGCKLNFAETSAIARQLTEAGYAKVDFGESSNVVVINTCSVTDNADKKCRKVIRQALQSSPDAKIVVTGCYAQLKPTEIASIPGVSMVLGAAEKFEVARFLEKAASNEWEIPLVVQGEIEEVRQFNNAWSLGERTRTFLKVQDGCDYNCAFCTIPLARGASRSATISQVLDQVKTIAQTGIREIVLTGVNIGDFGKGNTVTRNRQETFLDLIQELGKEKGIDRFRISSIEPNLLTDEIIAFVAQSERFMPHFHIPMQSGCDATLKRMKRRYLTDLYRGRIETIRKLMPDCCIGVDVIVGFPGEDETEFQQTHSFLADLEVSYLHVFTYSERPNTKAIDMPGSVPQKERENRSRILRTLSARKKGTFYRQFLGQVRPVLWESDEEDGMMTGFTDNYINVCRPFDPDKINTIEQVILSEMVGIGKVAAGDFIPQETNS